MQSTIFFKNKIIYILLYLLFVIPNGTFFLKKFVLMFYFSVSLPKIMLEEYT